MCLQIEVTTRDLMNVSPLRTGNAHIVKRKDFEHVSCRYIQQCVGIWIPRRLSTRCHSGSSPKTLFAPRIVGRNPEEDV